MSTKTFATLVQTLSVQKLSALTMFGEGSGIVPEAQNPRIIAAVNTARDALFTRFRISQKMLTLAARTDTHTYYLRPEYALNSGSISPIKYIIDSPADPFLGGLARVERVYGPNGDVFSVDDDNNPTKSVFFIAHDALQITNPRDGDLYNFEYRAAPNHLDVGTVNPDSLLLDIPDPYWEAFLCRIAAEVSISLGGQDNTLRGANFMQAYEAQCQQLMLNNVDLSHQSVTNTRFKAGGWF